MVDSYCLFYQLLGERFFLITRPQDIKTYIGYKNKSICIEHRSKSVNVTTKKIIFFQILQVQPVQQDLQDLEIRFYCCCESINKGFKRHCCELINIGLKGTVVNWPIKGLRYCCELSIRNLQSRRLQDGEKLFVLKSKAI